ncbi:MAG TPA: hypothetical protein VLD39_06210 [Gammaproteobacteria bacterium]|nr:hypothetical protein [Gammaproteobacteria bacterium]
MTQPRYCISRLAACVRPGALLGPLAAGCLLGVDALAQENAVQTQWRAYAQLTAEDLPDESLSFGADRIRVRGAATLRQVTAGFMLDFGVDDLGDAKPGALANVVGDLYLNYRPSEKHLVRFGQFKTPLGMDFNIPGRSLDITKRGMEAGLVLNRDLGLMLSGRSVWRGLGYDIGIFNVAGRSPATAHVDAQVGDDHAQALRLHYDADRWHLEIARARSEAAGGPQTADYDVSDVAMSFRDRGWTFKAEWTEGKDIRGIADQDERVYYLHGAYRIRPALELVARHYEGESRLASGATELSNTYLGLTAFLQEHSRMTTRLQINYVIAGGDERIYTGLSGHRDDTLLVQLQLLTQK